MKAFATILSLLVATSFACEEAQFGLTSTSDCAILYKNNDCRYVHKFRNPCLKGIVLTFFSSHALGCISALKTLLRFNMNVIAIRNFIRVHSYDSCSFPELSSVLKDQIST